MDARRLGMGIALPQAFLEAAAPGYLTDAEWDALGEDWLEQALAYTAKPLQRRPRAAHPHPSPPGQIPRNRLGSRDSDEQLAGGPASTPGGPLYRLADYLDQHGRTTGRARSPRPASGPPRQTTPSPPTRPRSVMPPTPAACTAPPPSSTRTPPPAATSSAVLYLTQPSALPPR